MSNTSAKPGAILRELSEGALATGMPKQAIEDPRRLIYVAEMLNDMYDINSPRGFQGSIERAGENTIGVAQDIAGGVADVASLRPLSLIERGMKYFTPDIKIKRQQIIKKIVDEALKDVDGGLVSKEVSDIASTPKKKVNPSKIVGKKNAAGGVAGIEMETDEYGRPTGKVGFDPKKAAMGMVGMTVAKRYLPNIEKASKEMTPEIADTMEKFIDYTRLKKTVDLNLEEDAARMAEDLGLKMGKTNKSLADQFDEVLARFREIGEPKLGKESLENLDDTLIQQAKKFKSADEFVKAQGKPVYHGTSAKFDAFDATKRGMNEKDIPSKNAFFFTDSMDTAKSYGEKVMEGYGKFKKPITLDAEGKMYGDMRDEMYETVMKAKKEGNDVIIIKNMSDRKDWGNYESATHFAVLDINNIKTKSQLNDIWNKANNKTAQ